MWTRTGSIFLAAAAAALATSIGVRGAEAFCRSTTCDSPEVFSQCSGTPEGCQPLAWRRSCVGWNLHEAASVKVPFDVAEQAIDAAFLAWRDTSCSPGIQFENMGPVRCDKIEYNSLAGNANVIVFRDASWPHEGADHNIALTTVTFDVNTGEIFDADIEVNTFQFDLTWDDVMVNYDLASILTHEVGHFLGLSHSEKPEATMYRHYDVGSVAFRDLSDDDSQGICEAYPPFETLPPACNPIPRHGFSPDCASLQKEGTCSVAGGEGPSRKEDPAGLAAAMVALGACAALGRRARRGRAAPRT